MEISPKKTFDVDCYTKNGLGGNERDNSIGNMTLRLIGAQDPHASAREISDFKGSSVADFPEEVKVTGGAGFVHSGQVKS